MYGKACKVCGGGGQPVHGVPRNLCEQVLGTTVSFPLPRGCWVSVWRWQNTHIVSTAFQGTRGGTCVFPLSVRVALSIVEPGHHRCWHDRARGRTPAGCSPPRRTEAVSWGENLGTVPSLTAVNGHRALFMGF